MPKNKGANYLSVQIGVIIAVGGLIISFLAYQLNLKKEVKTDSKDSAELRAELGYIRKGVDDIRIDIKSNEKQMIQLGERVTRVEESTKQAHKRIDYIEKGE